MDNRIPERSFIGSWCVGGRLGLTRRVRLGMVDRTPFLAISATVDTEVEPVRKTRPVYLSGEGASVGTLELPAN